MTHVLTRVFKLWIPGVIIIYQEGSRKPTQKGVTTLNLFLTRQWRHVKNLIVLRIWTKKQKHVPLIWHITCLFCFYIRQVQSACDTFIIYDQNYSLKICHALIYFYDYSWLHRWWRPSSTLFFLCFKYLLWYECVIVCEFI